MSTVRDQLIELFYDNNVHCDQTIEHLVDDVTDIIKDSDVVSDCCSKEKASCKDCFHYCVCKDTVADENWKEDTPKEVREMFSPSGCKNYVPAANVVEARHGHWKREENAVCYWYVCSECKDEIPRNKYGGWSFPSYCPNCGAEMKRKGSDIDESSDKKNKA